MPTFEKRLFDRLIAGLGITLIVVVGIGVYRIVSRHSIHRSTTAHQSVTPPAPTPTSTSHPAKPSPTPTPSATPTPIPTDSATPSLAGPDITATAPAPTTAPVATAAPTGTTTTSTTPTARPTPTGTTTSTPTPTPTGTATAPTESARAELHEVLADAKASKYVHIESVLAKPGSDARFSQDDGLNDGVKHITVDGGAATVKVVGATTYLKADEVVLRKYFGFSATAAQAGADQWLSLKPGDRDYAAITRDVTLGSVLDDLNLTGPLTRIGEHIKNGQKAVGIRGTITIDGSPITATVWVSEGSHPLPVEFVATTPRVREHAAFSQWGTAFTVSPPLISEPEPPVAAS